MDLLAKIRTLPTKPGCYLYKNAEGEVIYVGKAKNLRARVRSYFLAASQANAKTGSLMREAVDIDYIQVANEHEALALENNLIKQRKPRFNILLRDDKTYPYIKLTLGDRYPKVFVTRRLKKDGSAYFGPYFPGNLAYRLVDLIHRSFLIPSCKVDLSRYHSRACLQYYIKRCLGPCVEGFTTPEAYREAVRDVQLFLDGRESELEGRLRERMAEAAAAEQYELAARMRDQIITVQQLQEVRNDILHFIGNEYLAAVKLDFFTLTGEVVAQFREVQHAGQIEWVVYIQMDPEKRIFAEWIKLFVKCEVIFVFEVRRAFCPDRAWVVDYLVLELDLDRQELAIFFQDATQAVRVQELF